MHRAKLQRRNEGTRERRALRQVGEAQHIYTMTQAPTEDALKTAADDESEDVGESSRTLEARSG